MFRHNDTSSPRWRKITSIEHDFTKKGPILTLGISNNQLKCCSAGDKRIKVYSLSGELLKIHSTGDCSFIHEYDNEGSPLMATHNNGRLQVMSEQGELSVLQLQPPVSWPRNAVLFDNQLYVTSMSMFDDYEKICRYALAEQCMQD